MSDEIFSPIRWDQDALLLLDQTVLPAREEWLRCRHPEDVAGAIRRLSVRGAPAIGVAAAFGLVLAVDAEERDGAAAAQAVASASRLLLSTRPTAVNLRWALDRGAEAVAAARARDASAPELRAELLDWAQTLRRRDIEANQRLGEHGKTLFATKSRVLTHCNTGSLATAGFGTALGVIQSAFRDGRVSTVWVDETRPLLQGARLTAWELSRLGIPFHVVTDSSAGALMARGEVDAIVVGADRIAANGDTANKIGTYTVAVLAYHHGVPFYIAAPVSTVDLATPSGAAIPIEERAADEVTQMFGVRIAPAEAAAFNLAFDVTPAALITAIITDAGVPEAPLRRQPASRRLGEREPVAPDAKPFARARVAVEGPVLHPRRGRTCPIATAVAVVVLLAVSACTGPRPSDFTEATAREFLAARGLSASPDDLVRAAGNDALDIAAAILAAGVSPDALDGMPLAVAARLGNLEMLQMLLESGADPNRSGPRAQTPLAFAVLHRQDETIDLLLESGANPDGGSQSSSRPLLFRHRRRGRRTAAAGRSFG